MDDDGELVDAPPPDWGEDDMDALIAILRAAKPVVPSRTQSYPPDDDATEKKRPREYHVHATLHDPPRLYPEDRDYHDFDRWVGECADSRSRTVRAASMSGWRRGGAYD